MSFSGGGPGASGTLDAPRWRLSRAGIVNVYQYEDEVLHFAGGRLLLRGVNGSGKSTAMNMLLPFLLTARQGRIDAAGEQVGILKSWMLADRDDPQPVGYLWIELERSGRHLTCGCGIKANRQSDTVTTWWFVTERRPGIDLQLVEGGAALSADALRAVLDGEPVFPEARRRDYRAEVERRLFGGASIDQHIGLINVVRNPRVGDRIDLDLPGHLRDALPQLSEQALAEAAQPLDDLDDHRRNVAELERTRDAVDGLLRVYRDYCTHDLHDRVDAARQQAARASDLHRSVGRATDRAARAAADVERIEAEISRLVQAEDQLRTEIDALKASRAYQSGQELEGLRQLVRELQRSVEAARDRLAGSEAALERASGRLLHAQGQSHDDLRRLNELLASVQRDAAGFGLAQRGPGPLAVDEQRLDGVEASEPVAALDHEPAAGALSRVRTAIAQRRVDVDEVRKRRAGAERAEQRLRQAEGEVAATTERAETARRRRDEALQLLAATRAHWREQAEAWAGDLERQASSAGHAVPRDLRALTDAPDADEEVHRATLLGAAESLVEVLEERLARAAASLGQRQEEEAAAQAEVGELAARSEPDPPRVPWQIASDHCLADLVDFAPHLDAVQRAGLEAALEASGLLSARVAADGSARLASGDLVVVVAGGVAAPLADLLTVTVPEHLVGDVDPGLVAKLLDSITHDPATGAATAAATDGSFRVGALHGRHAKEAAEHIGVTARRAALERARREAARRLEEAHAAVLAATATHGEAEAARGDARRLRDSLPSTREIQSARSAYTAAEHVAAETEAARVAAAEALAEAERASAAASDELHRVATSLALPADSAGLDSFQRSLDDLDRNVTEGGGLLTALARSVEAWMSRAAEWREARELAGRGRSDLAAAEAAHGEAAARLVTIEDAIGVEYAEVVATIDRCETDLARTRDDLSQGRDGLQGAVSHRATAHAELATVTRERDAAEDGCEAARRELSTVLALPGLLDALAAPPADPPPGAVATQPDAVPVPAAAHTGSAGLADLAGQLAALLPPRPADAPNADGVRQSLRSRRDSLGAGWDAEARQPDPSRPVTIEVNGPNGKAPLAAAARSVADQHRQLAGLLNAKQDAALRELLQGLIAREVAEKVHGAGRLVDLMNDRLATVATAHDISVRLRWRRSPELDEPTARMVELLATLPDLRTEDDESELRGLLSAHLDRARREQPDVPYRQQIASTLDYRQWHDLTVLVKRGDKETPLGRRTQLSEGEKKLVTYLPLFAAVAASCDALAAQAAAPGDPPAGVPRFVLLDDAFAKVSEDNHAKLFGLLVDLDLDLIATSERLWGTHGSVPELAITEVVRDASAGVILLEHYRWDGHTLERLGAR